MKLCTKCTTYKDFDEFYTNSNQCKECKKAYTRKWKKNNPGYHLASLLRSKYDMSLTEYDELRRLQNYSCAICHKHENDTVDRLHVDHCHALGHVRGLLCTQCNTALGLFKDNPQLMEAGAQYVKDRKSSRSAKEKQEESCRSPQGRSYGDEGVSPENAQFSQVSQGLGCYL